MEQSRPPPDPICPVGGYVWMQGCTSHLLSVGLCPSCSSQHKSKAAYANERRTPAGSPRHMLTVSLEGFPLFITASLVLLVFTVGRGGEVLGLIHWQVKPRRRPPGQPNPE